MDTFGANGNRHERLLAGQCFSRWLLAVLPVGKKLMMRVRFLLCAMLGAVTGLQAQGLVVFHNLIPHAAITNGQAAQPAVPGPTFKAALYYARDSGSTPADSAFAQIGPAVDFGPSPGHFHGGLRTTPGTTAPGQPAYFQVRVWEAAYGATYEAAIAAPNMNGRPALRGTSNKVRVPATGNPVSFPPQIPPALTWHGLQSFTITYPGLGQ